MSWFDKIAKAARGKKVPKPEDLWIECKKCKEQIYISELEKNYKVCPKCDFHFRLDARARIQYLINSGTFMENNHDMMSADPIRFKDTKKYRDRIRALFKQGLTHDALVTGSGLLGIHKVEICVFEFDFMGGSMGSVVGEKITCSIERALENKNPLIIVSCSGGARMQEGILSLMQMAKTSAALRRLSEHRIPYISVLTDPTTGGVSASFAMLGDIILAEPQALVGFAGPRVIEQTIQQKLPEGFQRAEFLVEHGLIDQVVHRKELKQTLDRL
ncbi:MAG: acetyl-CoA carboxylase carboxyltransferase subunit beta, partial [Nitrospinaceae bacterium]|nr:acetyl-CoA carboxylase carboxyltransferase subunit beta [Nitrospinaceae bacterium]NIR55074.1 acetyl-CoA carboxylase carboxyltransferase subunit beta [Nitrospinaceae bacterium]NIS85483.1 acetyl-CoA carboxylase carboxyltransferase subunit beta [Nitrospinaceae bacterium]NIT82321.1 acetyl-CoA carboxylase carboxyltransferase subunit beta [Nitrospinaceae bacterium]NIU44539.1 acetyl-CoA carboxylase carboxyltransferase subunit beta [Nitrospinaceae bacterium]